MGGDQGLTGPALAGLLEAQGYDFFTGVPCSMIEGLIATLEAHPRLPYVSRRGPGWPAAGRWC
jgi:sulfopyruvate decarboxylase TPP-binding subunit